MLGWAEQTTGVFAGLGVLEGGTLVAVGGEVGVGEGTARALGQAADRMIKERISDAVDQSPFCWWYATEYRPACTCQW